MTYINDMLGERVNMTVTVDELVQQATQLPVMERVQLIQRLTETLVTLPNPATNTGLWQFGIFKGDNPSTEEDFALAEWHPTDEELDG